MPELPEVETIKCDLDTSVRGLSIVDVDIYDQRVIKDDHPAQFRKTLCGKEFCGVSRVGKALIFPFTDQTFMIVQLKMTGQLIYGENLKTAKKLKETKVVFRLSNGKFLNYNDQRLFGWLIYAKQLKDVPFLNLIGLDPLSPSFELNWLNQSLKRHKTPIKPLLMNQQFLAGIGNIYASEILFQARINPRKRSDRLTHSEIASLHHSTVDILQQAIIYRGTSIRNYRDARGKKGLFNNRIKVYGREQQGCSTCQRPIQRIVQSGRSTFYCAHCQ